jgi:hypothetical protein
MKSSFDRGHCNSRSSNSSGSCRDSKKGGLYSVFELCVCVCVYECVVCVVCVCVCVCVCVYVCVCVVCVRERAERSGMSKL